MKHTNILSSTFALILFFIVSFFALDFNGYNVTHLEVPKTATAYAACAQWGETCQGVSNACGDFYWGTYSQTCQCIGGQTAPPTPYSAGACGGGSNACFTGTSGTTDVCTGACNGSVAPQPLPGGYGNACNINSCGTAGGTINCSGTCSGATPATPYSATSCGGGSNACFSGTSGTTDVCTGACNGSVAPQALPGGYGNSCNVNACGTPGGTINCAGSCSGATPATPYSATSCAPSCSTGYVVSTNGTRNVCTNACTGGSCVAGTYAITWNGATGGTSSGASTCTYGNSVTPTCTPSSGYSTASCASFTCSTSNSFTPSFTLNVPTVASTTLSNLTGTTATFGANVTVGAALTARGTCWGLSASPVTNCVAEGATTTGVFTQARTGLTAGTLIYFRGYATNAAGTGYSADSSTTTLATPVVVSPTSSSVTGTTATLGATVSSTGGSAITARGVCWALTPSPITNCVSSGTATGTYTQSVTGLPINSTIYYRGYATNAYGTSYSSDSTITTPNIPTLTTTTLTALANTTATFGATLFSNGGETVSSRGTCWDYTAFPTANCLADGSTTTGVFTQARNGLPQGSLIYFRGYATNSAGTGYSSDNSTTTLTTGTVSTPTYSALTDTTVTLGATVVSTGGSAILARGTCWGLTANPVSNCLAEGGTALGSFTQARTGLPTGTVIFVRGYVTNAYGTTYTIDNSFTTFSPPILTSPTVSLITNTTGTFGATVTSNGGAVLTARGTCFGNTPSPVTNCLPEGSISTGAFTQARTLLTPNTLIYIRGYATNLYGTSYSGDISTTTVANLSGVTVTPGNTQARVDYITTTSVNPYTVIVLRSTAPITDTPVNSTTYTVGNTIGASTVGCVDSTIVPGTADGCIVSSLTNNVPYYFKVFTKETATGAYDAGTIPDGSPSTPDINATLINLSSFRTRNDDGTEVSATYNANENTSVTSNFLLGDKLRARFVVENQKTVLTNKSYQLEYATGSCMTWTQVPRPSDVTTEHFRVEPSSFISDNTITTHSGGVSVPNGKMFIPGRVQTFSNVTQPIVLKNNEYTEIEYSLRSTGNVTPYAPYCFRLTGRGDASDFNYSQVLHITPFSSVFRAQAGGGGGGGASAAVVNIEAPSTVATTTTTGGDVKTEATTPTEQGVQPGSQQSTTTPTRRQGGGGNVGLLNSASPFAMNTDTVGKVLGATSMCVIVPRNLHRGIESVSVSTLQKYLISLSLLTGNATGFYGDATIAAVKKYQYSRNIKSTGMVYEETRRTIQEESCGN